ncbi:TIGR02680 family protein [Paenibacillus sp. FSL R7-0331]|uniref:TIGR02680 family protein n=1 Tax=Paenibacillus sp. FSL R7-0331 TaxID=1536773 RepID=UPI0018CEA72A|nr:TIGR02680 family protein [Paenibacillus sp. FSL R7-0331]
MALERWQMNRAGVLNFWYYDEEVFGFEEGRMILRGTNGSGKSVTMQSLIPLVLDGDKRPERLDPFGSRDRKLEYYLLGDSEHGHTDRTGYLWMEFHHPAKNIYKTIGIGLRARRGTAQLGFWGFLLEDGRRINHDFWLYNNSLWREQGSKVPLNRKELEIAVDSGGRVVQEQREYRDLVNAALFGFQDSDSYKDLLKLLLELRSPKLSKDFKPSSMYEILTKALPPLMEDDLNSLSDVIEDMDQITDRLDELNIQVEDMRKLNDKYNEYNRFLLLHHSEIVLKQFQVYDESEKQVIELTRQVQMNGDDKDKVISAIEHRKLTLKEIDAGMDILNRSEVIEKQRELGDAEEQIKDTQKQLVTLNERIERNSNNLLIIENEIAKSQNKLEQLEIEQNNVIDELEDTARVIEFREHDIYHNIWLRGILEDESWVNNWIKDLSQHREELNKAYNIACEEREAYRKVTEAELSLGEIHRERIHVEEEREGQANLGEIIKASMKERLIRWQQELHQLPVNNETIREVLRVLTSLTANERQYDRVRYPAIQVFQIKNQELIEQSLRLQHHKELLQSECNKLEQELEQWKTTKEPEPVRKEKRKNSRKLRSLNTGSPLYAVCEFNETLPEDVRPHLEETLEQAGILDAWIFPGGNVAVIDWEHNEEVWLEPSLKSTKSSLADVLCATPSLESGLTVEDIMSALNGIDWDNNTSDIAAGNEKLAIGPTGFCIGGLSGKGFSKERAEYIGKETRIRTKQILIADIETNISQLSSEIVFLDEQLRKNEHNKGTLQSEINAFPDDRELQEHFDTSIQLTHRLKEIMSQEFKLEVQYREKLSTYKKLQLTLEEATRKWSALKNEKRIWEALDSWPSYRERVTELQSLCVRHNEISQHQLIRMNQQNDIVIQAEEDEAEKDLLEEKRIKCEAKIRQLRKLMLEMGSEEIYEQLAKLKQSKTSLNNQLTDLENKKDKLIAILASHETNLNTRKDEYERNNDQLQLVINFWHSELQLKLIHEWKDTVIQTSDKADIKRICRQIKKTYEFGNINKDRLGNEVQQICNVVESNLREYMLQLEYLLSGRILITSNRDRLNPLPPSVLLEELIQQRDEQRILLTQRDRELYEEIIIGSVGKAIRKRIHRAKDWVLQMDSLMNLRDTSSGLKLSLSWEPKKAETETEIPTDALVGLLLRDAHQMDDEEIDQVVEHFRTRILKAKVSAEEEQGMLRHYLNEILDYRSWFEFRLYFRKGEQLGYKELTDSKFNVLSGGERAMAMYIPLFAATYSRYSDARDEAPKIISLDEAFAGVDDANMRDMFQLITEMGFDYIMTSQVLWGCYDTVPRLAIYEIYRPKDVRVVTLFHYRWNGKSKMLVEPEPSLTE